MLLNFSASRTITKWASSLYRLLDFKYFVIAMELFPMLCPSFNNTTGVFCIALVYRCVALRWGRPCNVWGECNPELPDCPFWLWLLTFHTPEADHADLAAHLQAKLVSSSSSSSTLNLLDVCCLSLQYKHVYIAGNWGEGFIVGTLEADQWVWNLCGNCVTWGRWSNLLKKREKMRASIP